MIRLSESSRLLFLIVPNAQDAHCIRSPLYRPFATHVDRLQKDASLSHHQARSGKVAVARRGRGICTACAHSPNNPENANAAKQTLATQKPPVYHNKTIVETCLGTKTITADTKMPDSDVGCQTRMSEMEYIPRLELAVLAGDS